MTRDSFTIPCQLGPLDGEEREFSASGWLVEVTKFGAHKYVLRQDDSGARYWSHYEVVPLTSAVR